MSDSICSVDECPARVLARGWCRRHYTRWYETGSIELGVRRRGNNRAIVPLAERFWVKVNKTDTCWLWTGGVNGPGYGQVWVNAVEGIAMAHRVSWEMVNGPIPEGLQIDHLCRVPRCVRPDHLEPVTQSENTRRGLAPSMGAAFQKAKTRCPQGHPYSDENTYRYGNRRVCKTCIFERTYARREALKGRAQ